MADIKKKRRSSEGRDARGRFVAGSQAAKKFGRRGGLHRPSDGDT